MEVFDIQQYSSNIDCSPKASLGIYDQRIYLWCRKEKTWKTRKIKKTQTRENIQG
jgi:hypothetical protein